MNKNFTCQNFGKFITIIWLHFLWKGYKKMKNFCIYDIGVNIIIDIFTNKLLFKSDKSHYILLKKKKKNFVIAKISKFDSLGLINLQK